jgi:hypothetical protein
MSLSSRENTRHPSAEEECEVNIRERGAEQRSDSFASACQAQLWVLNRVLMHGPHITWEPSTAGHCQEPAGASNSRPAMGKNLGSRANLAMEGMQEPLPIQTSRSSGGSTVNTSMAAHKAIAQPDVMRR